MEEELERLDQQLETDNKLLAAVKALARERCKYDNLPSVETYLLEERSQLPLKAYSAVVHFYYVVSQVLKMGVDDELVGRIIRFVKAKIKATPPRTLDEEFKRVAQELSVPASRVRR